MLGYRRTKIIATLGPASDDLNTLEKLIVQGVNVFRINFSHGSQVDQIRRIDNLKKLSEKTGKVIAILADLQGPKLRICRFKNNKIELKADQRFILDAELEDSAGDENAVGIDYKALPNDVIAGDELVLNDGCIILHVEKVEGKKIHTTVTIGGELSNNKGLNRRGGGLSAEALTEKDKKDLAAAIEHDVDYIALSFPRCAADVELTKALIKQHKGHAHVIAKIERAEALENLDDIIHAADGVMVARGDLGVEIGDPQLPAAQKRIVHQARTLNKPVIIATQMMETMITNPCPTRAEVFDVANAVSMNADAVMLSAETAVGEHPVKVVNSMGNICLGAEKNPATQLSRHRVDSKFQRVDEAIAMATMYTANHLNIKAIVCLTESGTTPLMMSRIRTGIPIFALSRHHPTCRKMALYLGVYPIYFDSTQHDTTDVNQQAIDKLKSLGILNTRDKIILTRGDYIGVHGQTNLMKILEV